MTTQRPLQRQSRPKRSRIRPLLLLIPVCAVFCGIYLVLLKQLAEENSPTTREDESSRLWRVSPTQHKHSRRLPQLTKEQRQALLTKWQTKAMEDTSKTTTAKKNTCAALYDYDQIKFQYHNRCLYHSVLQWSACRLGDSVRISLNQIEGARGNESVHDVEGRSEESEYLVFPSNTFQVTEPVPPQLFSLGGNKLASKGLNRFKDSFSVVNQFTENETLPSRKTSVDGRPIVNIFVKRETYANPCFIVAQIYSVFLLLYKFQLFNHFIRIIWLDGHAWSPTDMIWTSLFDAVLHVNHLSNKNETTVILENTYLLNTESAFLNVGLAYYKKGDVCPISSSLHDFRQFIFEFYNVVPKVKGSTKRPLLTFLTRTHYKAHPRSNGRTDRTMADPSKDLDYLRQVYPDYDIELVSFEQMPFRDQLVQISRTDLLVAVHGAGNIHVVFLPLHAKLVEYFPKGGTWSGRVRFRYLAHALGIAYAKQTARTITEDKKTGYLEVSLVPLESHKPKRPSGNQRLAASLDAAKRKEAVCDMNSHPKEKISCRARVEFLAPKYSMSAQDACGFALKQGFCLASADKAAPPQKEVQNATCLELHPTPKLKSELNAQQLALVQKYAAGKKSYLEWGTGGSTDVVSRLIDGPAFSIENHPQWCQKVQTTPYVACRIKAGSFSFQCVDTGPVREYGNPKNETDIPKFANYVQAVKEFGLPTFDFIMDDGRSRVAVAFQAFQYMQEDSILAIHDYPEDDKNERIDYRRVEEYFERMKDSVGTKIAIFRKRPGSKGPPADVLEKELANYH